MSEKEKAAAEELMQSLREVPKSAEDFVRGYIKGCIDTKKDEKEAG